MDSSWPIGLFEMLIVLAFAVGWGILELTSLRMDKKKQAEKAKAEAEKSDGSHHAP